MPRKAKAVKPTRNMSNYIREAQQRIEDFNQHLRDIFYDEYPAQLVQDNPAEYNRLLNEFLESYTPQAGDAVYH